MRSILTLLLYLEVAGATFYMNQWGQQAAPAQAYSPSAYVSYYHNYNQQQQYAQPQQQFQNNYVQPQMQQIQQQYVQAPQRVEYAIAPQQQYATPPQLYATPPVYVTPPPAYPTPPPTYPTPPPEKCYRNEFGMKCCSRELENFMKQQFAKEENKMKWQHCNIQKQAIDMQLAAEANFGHSFESVIGPTDFVSKSYYDGELNCKTRAPDGKVVLLYGTPDDKY